MATSPASMYRSIPSGAAAAAAGAAMDKVKRKVPDGDSRRPRVEYALARSYEAANGRVMVGLLNREIVKVTLSQLGCIRNVESHARFCKDFDLKKIQEKLQGEELDAFYILPLQRINTESIPKDFKHLPGEYSVYYKIKDDLVKDVFLLCGPRGTYFMGTHCSENYNNGRVYLYDKEYLTLEEALKCRSGPFYSTYPEPTSTESAKSKEIHEREETISVASLERLAEFYSSTADVLLSPSVSALRFGSPPSVSLLPGPAAAGATVLPAAATFADPSSTAAAPAGYKTVDIGPRG
jgi:hypothetical protein